jgi:hypothetical protein
MAASSLGSRRLRYLAAGLLLEVGLELGDFLLDFLGVGGAWLDL